MNKEMIEDRVTDRGYRFCGAWRATPDDVWRGENSPYSPPAAEGDTLVEMIGFDSGAVAWIENWGDER